MKILVVVDMQNDFIDGSLGTAEAQAIVPKVVEKIKNFDGAFAVTYDTHCGNYVYTQEGRRLPVAHCMQLTDGWELNADVFDALFDKEEQGNLATSFVKTTFGSTDLGEWISKMDEEYGVEEVTLIGLCTDICVISNAMLIKAFCPEIEIKIDASCCAGVTPESHANALRAMQVCQMDIENWEE